MFRAGTLVLLAAWFAVALWIPDSKAEPRSDRPRAGHQSHAGHRANPAKPAIDGPLLPAFGQPIQQPPTYYLQWNSYPNQEPSRFLWIPADGWVAIFTGLLFASTFLLWWVTDKTLKHAEKSSERQLRAYLWTRAVALRDMEIGKLPSVDLEIRNSGATPAYDMNVLASGFVQPYPLPPNTPFPAIGSGSDKSKLVLHPGAEPPFGASAKWRGLSGLTAGEHALLVAGDTVRLFVFVLIEYVDAFRQPRETRACFSVKMTPAVGRTGQFARSF